MRSDPRGLSVGDPGLTAAHRAFDRWRRRASARRSRRIPPELWERARELAQAHGVSRTARELGLDYYALAKRVQATERRGGNGSGVNEASAFVELTMPAVAAPPRGPSCRLELSDGGGTRLCVELSGAEPREIEALARGLWSAAR
jgi:hypothetical protein